MRSSLLNPLCPLAQPEPSEESPSRWVACSNPKSHPRKTTATSAMTAKRFRRKIPLDLTRLRTRIWRSPTRTLSRVPAPAVSPGQNNHTVRYLDPLPPSIVLSNSSPDVCMYTTVKLLFAILPSFHSIPERAFSRRGGAPGCWNETVDSLQRQNSVTKPIQLTEQME